MSETRAVSWTLLADRLRAEGLEFASSEGSQLRFLSPPEAANEPRIPWCDR